MKFTKENLWNFTFIILLALLLFTPVGFHARVFVSRIFSMSPSIADEEEQLILSDYNWQLVELNGKSFDFKAVKGKIVLVNFWATWCPPCVAEMPSLEELHKDYGNQVAFVLIAHDKKEKVKAFLNEKDYGFPVYFEVSSSPDLLSTGTIPTTFIIDKNGKIVVKKTGAANWNSASTRALIENLLKE